MATTPIQTESIAEQQAGATHAPILLSLPSLPLEAYTDLLQTIAEAFAGQQFLIATPDGHTGPNIVPYIPSTPADSSWTLNSADFLNAHEMAVRHRPETILVLGAEAQSLAADTLRNLAKSIAEGADLAVPHYALPARAGLVNSAILYPVTRALFGTDIRFPLALDLALSPRMAERLATVAQRHTAVSQPGALIWPVAEAAVASFKVVEVPAGSRLLPQPTVPDLNTLLAQVTGSLFADVDAKAAFWQRNRIAAPGLPAEPNPTAFGPEDVGPMLDSFRLAYGNLHEIWSLVLPPQSLLGLKRLSTSPQGSFRMADSLWARIVCDFVLAYRLRTINRGHLLGALTPLYLAWAASHILLAQSGTDPEQHIEALASAFEADKAYLVSRWRWPDRFNP